MRRVRLIHWNAAEAAERAARLRAAGYAVDAAPLDGERGLHGLRERPPLAVVIDLSRLPTQGRDVGIAIRHAGTTRRLPLVFVGGEPEKVARVRAHLPDAVYASWNGIRGALKRAIEHPPAAPVAPASRLAGYSGRPLAQKLGIKPGMTIALVGAPPGFRGLLRGLPRGARLRAGARGRCGLALRFLRSRAELRRAIPGIVALAGGGPVWIVWPKRSSATAADLAQQEVREAGLAAGLVDYKVAAIDATWSGLLFTRRRKPRGA